jgi:hypothetical protein
VFFVGWIHALAVFLVCPESEPKRINLLEQLAAPTNRARRYLYP